jgi:hypothetical protein
MSTPPEFTFSQSSLQAYEDCPRRFWLTYVAQLPWPASAASPIYEHEQLLRLGETFHRLVERTESAMAPQEISAGLQPPLATWYQSYLTQRPADLPTEHVEVERVLVTEMVFPAEPTPDRTPARRRLAAKYDLIAAETGGRVVIVDWKTGQRRPDPAALRRRLQSAVYPFVLVEASANLPWGPVRPEQVEMRYWFTAAPGQPVVLTYDGAQHAANRTRLQRLLAEAASGRDEADYPKVADTEFSRRRHCAVCIYRSRCNRGATAGDLHDLDDPEDFAAEDMTAALQFSLDELEVLAF